MGYFNLINLKGWKPVTTWLNCLDSCWHHWRFGQSHKLFIYSETRECNWYISEVTWSSSRYYSVCSKSSILENYSCTCNPIKHFEWCYSKIRVNIRCKTPCATHRDWNGCFCFSLEQFCFSKLTKSFMCFEGMPV